MVVQLIHNLTLLVTLGVAAQLLTRHLDGREMLFKLATGVLFGAVGVAGMMMPVRFAPGVIYDGRTIIVGLAALLGGPVAAVISTVACGAMRLHVGGAGQWVGVGTIVGAAAIGTASFYLRRRGPRWRSLRALLAAGVAIHLVMVALQLPLPGSISPRFFRSIAVPVLLLFPPSFVVLAMVALDGRRRREAERTRHKREELLQLSQAVGQVGSWESEPETGRLVWSAQTYRIFGMEPGRIEPSLDKFAELIHPDDREKVMSAYFQSVQEGRDGYQIEHRIVRADTGEVRIVDERCEHEHDASGRVRRSIGIVQDITDRKQTEAALRESSIRLQEAIRAANVGLWNWDLTTNEVFYSPEWKRQLGWAEDEITGDFEEWRSRVHPDDLKRTQRSIEHFLASGRDHYEIEFRMRHRDGSYRDILAQASIFRDEDGRAIRALGSHVDVTEAKRTERALRESQAELQRAQRVANVGSWRLSLESGEVTASDEARRIYGVEPGKTTLSIDEVRQYPLEEYRGMLDDAMERLIRQCQPYDVEFRIARRADGEIRDIHSVAQYDAEKRMVFGIIQDITDRRRAEEAYGEICRMTSELICIADLDSARFLQVNPAFEKLLGYTSQELTERSFLEFVHPDDLEATRAVMRDELFQGQDVALFENRYRCADGTYRYLSWTSHLMDEAGKVFAIARDVTERKKVMRALRENEERFRSLVEGAPDAIVVQVAGKMAYVNAAAQELLGAESPDDLLGTDMLDRLPPETHERMRRRMERLNKHKQRVEPIEEIWLGLDGRQVPMEVSAVPTVYDGKDGAIVFGRDVRARKHLENQLLQAQKLEAVGRLAGGVAHDFNNMLQTILGYADVLLLERDEADPSYESLTEIRSAAQRSADLTRQLLAFARKQAIHPRTLELNDTVAGMLKMLQRLIREEIHLIWQPGRDVGWVRMDPAQIDQVLANLVVNARDAIRGAGTITIETGHASLTPEDCAELADAVPGEYASLAVSDDGQGMSPGIIDQIFEPFFTTKGYEEGTGLGLATVYGIVKQNRGFINVYSEPDVGTTFRAYLPRQERPEVGQGVEAESSARGGSETILLVEDDGAILRLGRQILAQLGYTVLAVASPGEALEICRERAGQIDLLLTDVVMPEMSGRDLAEQAEQYCPTMRCLYMSGYTANVIAHRGVLDADVEFIQKPFTRTALASKVREVLDNHRGQ